MKKLLLIALMLMLTGCSSTVQFDGDTYELDQIFTFEDGREYKVYSLKKTKGNELLEGNKVLQTYDNYGYVIFDADDYIIIEFEGNLYEPYDIIEHLESTDEFSVFGIVEKHYRIVHVLLMPNGDRVEVVEYDYPIIWDSDAYQVKMPRNTKFFIDGVEILVFERYKTVGELRALGIEIEVEVPLGG